MKKRLFLSSAILLIMQVGYSQVKYPIVDTGQNECYSNDKVIDMPEPGQDFYGQDACIQGNQPKYKDNGDGTVTDLVTGLMWEKDMGEKLTFEEAKEKAEKLRTGGYDDWRVPTIKELYSLIQFTGRSMGEHVITPYIDTNYFNQPIGDKSKGEREIDAQTWSSTIYKGKTMGGQTTVFGVNFVDGRIKGYPLKKRREENKMYFRMVRGNTEYGKNQLVDNGDGTVTANMGKPVSDFNLIKLDFDIDISGYTVNAGNPHFVILQAFEERIFDEYAKKISEYRSIFPYKTNVEFAEIYPDKNMVNVRVYERGSGETLACGTGATAVFEICHHFGFLTDNAIVKLKGGVLMCSHNSKGEILVTGDAKFNYKGETDILNGE